MNEAQELAESLKELGILPPEAEEAWFTDMKMNFGEDAPVIVTEQVMVYVSRER